MSTILLWFWHRQKHPELLVLWRPCCCAVSTVQILVVGVFWKPQPQRQRQRQGFIITFVSCERGDQQRRCPSPSWPPCCQTYSSTAGTHLQLDRTPFWPMGALHLIALQQNMFPQINTFLVRFTSLLSCLCLPHAFVCFRSLKATLRTMMMLPSKTNNKKQSDRTVVRPEGWASEQAIVATPVPPICFPWSRRQQGLGFLVHRFHPNGRMNFRRKSTCHSSLYTICEGPNLDA